jgi:hypothetical protein
MVMNRFRVKMDYGDKRMGSIWIGMIENNL